MDIRQRWEKALGQTEVVRPRIRALYTFSVTESPYIFLSESSINVGDTVVRKGSVIIQKPSLILPTGLPQFEGFEAQKELHIDESKLADFFLVRGVNLPSLKYNNTTYSLDLFGGSLKRAVQYFQQRLQQAEDVETGLIVGPEDCWQFSILLYISTQVVKSADGDVRRLLDEYRKGKDLDGN